MSSYKTYVFSSKDHTNLNEQPEIVDLTPTDKPDSTREIINRRDLLPDWFNKKNYHRPEELKAKEWYTELNLRALFYSTAKLQISDLPTERDWRSRQLFFGSQEIIGNHKEILLEIAANQFKNECVKFNNEIVFNGLITNNVNYSDAINSEFYSFKQKSTALYKANLLTPDNCLIEDFKLWLSEQRKSELAPLKGTRTPLSKQVITPKHKIQRLDKDQLYGLYECGLLPFLDLHQWSLLNNVRITQDVYGEAILPTQVDKGSSRIGENTITKAENIVTIIEVLWNQIQHDSHK